ncbi:SDR family NAD(P)-dependent oxidoreductase [Bacillus methanolicus]|uniref:Putative oxidoreductase YvaG n=2 Tax=Bacillus methanolicus TaxID=1471 RepID=I3DUC8_BACMM|nr:SDR family oxidoreductase [Bacillus methanolicus]AIE61265.1 putative oxidoreductase YvaG [Bacillus methanolicus MGA3]EIJ77849.1 Short chain dehydrogenase/reductase family protein [Bacillus methanolicus MGA3]
MDIKLNGKKAVISGSTTGIGFAIAKGLAKAGASVLLNGRFEEQVTEAVERLKREIPGAEACGFAADLSSSVGVNELINYWPETDILVNNLGIFEPKEFFEITDEDWEHYFQVNVMSAVRLSRHYAKGMKEKGWGRVLFNGSVTGGFYLGEMVHYGAAKAAVLGLSRGLAESLAKSGVTVNAFIPGPTKTERNSEYFDHWAKESGKSFQEIEKGLFDKDLSTSLLGRFISTEEVANMVVFLASEQASAITGAALKVDGGIVRSLL